MPSRVPAKPVAFTALRSLKSQTLQQLRDLALTPAHRRAFNPLASAFAEMRAARRSGPEGRALRLAFETAQVAS